MTNLQAPPSRVIAGSEATLALPLGELSPKVTERAWQALTDSPKAFPCSGRVLRDCRAQREEVPLGCNLGKALTISPMTSLLSNLVLRDSHVASLLGMTNLGACQNFCDFLQNTQIDT